MKELGFLRETSEKARKDGVDSATKIIRTGLDEYLSIIFPDVHDWVHDKTIPGVKSRKRPDYRSEKLKMIVEFDGIQHYTSPLAIENDIEGTKFYKKLGYKVVRIPYFIQLTNKAVRQLFGVEINRKMFSEEIPSLDIKNKNTPAFLCIAGIKRMAQEFQKFPEQYRVNLEHLKKEKNDFLTGTSLLQEFYEMKKKIFDL